MKSLVKRFLPKAKLHKGLPSKIWIGFPHMKLDLTNVKRFMANRAKVVTVKVPKVTPDNSISTFLKRIDSCALICESH